MDNLYFQGLFLQLYIFIVPNFPRGLDKLNFQNMQSKLKSVTVSFWLSQKVSQSVCLSVWDFIYKEKGFSAHQQI